MNRHGSRHPKRRRHTSNIEGGRDQRENMMSNQGSRSGSLEPIEILSDDEEEDDIEITGSTGAASAPSVNSTLSRFTPAIPHENPHTVDDDDDDEIRIVDERLSTSPLPQVQDVVSTPIGVFGLSTPRVRHDRDRNSRTRVRDMPVSRRLRTRNAQPARPIQVRGPRLGVEMDNRFRALVAAIPSFAQFDRFLNRGGNELRAAAFLAALQNGGNFNTSPSADEVENSIMRRIERDNETELDSRFQREVAYNRKTLTAKKESIKKEVKGYTNDIKAGSHLGCELCGTILGEGIPNEFVVDSKYNENYEKHAKELRVQSPWICVAQITQADRDLLRRVFFNKCGHTFCGRCVKNIGNRPRRKRGTSNSGLSNMNPSLYAPAKCPAVSCNKQFTSKSLSEVYF